MSSSTGPARNDLLTGAKSQRSRAFVDPLKRLIRMGSQGLIAGVGAGNRTVHSDCPRESDGTRCPARSECEAGMIRCLRDSPFPWHKDA